MEQEQEQQTTQQEQTKAYKVKRYAHKVKPLCVLGTVTTDMGKIIAKELIEWLKPCYDIHEVLHDGSRFEYPALQYTQSLAIRSDQPVLYIHTKGGVNYRPESSLVRQMWKHEFGNVTKNQVTTWNGKRYFDKVATKTPRVACPYTASDNTTWYNAFVANPAAWVHIKPLQISTNRLEFERLFRDYPKVQVFPMVMQVDRQVGVHGKRMIADMSQRYGRDVVYLLGNGTTWHDNELRYALRSLEKYAIGLRNVYLAGNLPAWVNNSKLNYVRVNDIYAQKHRNMLHKIDWVCDLHIKHDEPFLVSSDDIILTKPFSLLDHPMIVKADERDGHLPAEAPTWREGEYKKQMVHTREFLEAHDIEPLEFNSHTLHPIQRHLFEQYRDIINEALESDKGIEPYCLLQGLLHKEGVPYSKVEDYKVRVFSLRKFEDDIKDRKWFSFGDQAIPLGLDTWLKEHFPTKSKYEL